MDQSTEARALRRFLAALAVAAALAGSGRAANLTSDELTQATSANNTDLFVIYPSGGPLKSLQWSVVKSLMQSALGPVYLQVGNSLSDVASPSSARNNLGLGTAAVQNVGTSGANVPLLNGADTWSGSQTWAAGATTAAPMVFQSGSLLTLPSAGAVEWDGANLYATKAAGPTRETLAYADGSNLSVSAVSTALSGTASTTLANGADSRFSALNQNSQSAAYGIVLSDAGKELYHPSADTTARTWTIPANASVAFPVATKIEVVNDCGAGVLTVAITSDALVWFPGGASGSRTLAACGMATLTKIGAARWAITGMGLS